MPIRPALTMTDRVVSIDAFRGLMLLSMTFNHLVLFPFINMDSLRGFLNKFVYDSFGYLSNSEGFFFLAGLTCGLVYTKLAAKGKAAELWPRAKKRIVHMYGIHVVLLFCFAALLTISESYASKWEQLHSLVLVWKDAPGIHYFLDHPWAGFFMGTVFLYLPPFFDILPVYMLFLAAAPFIIGRLNQGNVKSVLGVSVAFWLISQYLPTGLLEESLKGYLPVKLGWFHPFALQLLFVSGLILGFLYIKGSLVNAYQLLSFTALSLAILFLILRLTSAELDNPHHLGFLRLALFALKAFIAFFIARLFTLKPLALLGRHSLAVFSFHIALVYGLIFFLSEISSLPMWLQLICLCLSLSSIWIPTMYLQKQQRVRLAQLG